MISILYKRLWFLAIIMLFLCTACQTKQEKKHIKIAYNNWQESVAMSHVAQEILRNQGYEVELVYAKGSMPEVFSLLSKKKVDIFMNFWVPFSNKKYMEKYGDQLTKINTNYVNARIGFVVPEYMDIYSIDQLTSCDSLFNYTIVGTAKGTGLMIVAEQVLEAYGLSTIHLEYATEQIVTKRLHDAIMNKKPIVIGAWSPHWMYDRYNLKFLDDPLLSFGESQNIETYSWKGFVQKDKYATAFFSRIQFNDKTLSNLLNTYEQIEDPELAAKAWIESHAIIVDNWIPHE